MERFPIGVNRIVGLVFCFYKHLLRETVAVSVEPKVRVSKQALAPPSRYVGIQINRPEKILERPI